MILISPLAVARARRGVYKTKFFNPLINGVAKTKSRYVLSRGGAGSGKSYVHHQYELIKLIDADHDTLVIRKYASDLHDSCYSLFKLIAENLGIYDEFIWNWANSKRQITSKKSGQRIMFKGIDDPEKIKSIVNVQRILVEEANQLNFEDFLELDRRVRGMKGVQISFVLNPVSEAHWLKKKFLDSKAYKKKITEFHTTYDDNQFLTEEDKERLDNLIHVDENMYRIYRLGEWGVENQDLKFCYAFSNAEHVGRTVRNPEGMHYLSFDFNKDPITALLIQEYNDEIHVVKAYTLGNSDIFQLCEHIRAEIGIVPLMITGDATGKASSALVKDNRNYYKTIRQYFPHAKFDVPSVNPKIVDNRMLVNAIFKKVKVVIDEKNAKALIDDCTYVEIEDGKILKDRSNEHRKADILDCFRYYCNTYKKHVLDMPWLNYKNHNKNVA